MNPNSFFSCYNIHVQFSIILSVIERCCHWRLVYFVVYFLFHSTLEATIVVDGMACLRHWYTSKDWLCGGQWKEYMDVLKSWVKTFTTPGIRLVFFFDGVVKEQKRIECVRSTCFYSIILILLITPNLIARESTLCEFTPIFTSCVHYPYLSTGEEDAQSECRGF